MMKPITKVAKEKWLVGVEGQTHNFEGVSSEVRGRGICLVLDGTRKERIFS